jgi:hypothetical protein
MSFVVTTYPLEPLHVFFKTRTNLHNLRALWLLALAALVPTLASAACVTGASNPGCVTFMMRTDSRFDIYTNGTPSSADISWINSHFWRMQTSVGYFDPTGLTWYKNAWAYVNSSSALTGEAVSSQHPEWILKSGPEPNGTKLYNGYVNPNGQSSRYALDIGDPAFRSWWISMAQGVVAKGYKGLWIDDVNFDGIHTSDINGNYVVPWDDRTGTWMTYTNWKQYFAEFVTQIRSAMPNVEILHNSIFYSGNSPDGSDPYVQQEIKAANWINRERGVSIGIDGTGGTGDKYSLISFLNFVDTVHSLGAYIDLQEFDFNGDYPVACYFLISTGKDLLGNNAIGMDASGKPAPGSNGAPTNWPANYDVQLGNPLGARYTWNGMYRRDFTNGLVIVNPPGGTQASYSLGSTYKDVSGNTVTSVNLAAKTGIVLLATSVPALSVSTSTLPNGTVGTSYSQTLAATGGTPPYTWSVTSGTLPAGLSLSAGGVLSGAPTTATTYSFTIEVTDSVPATATHAYTVLINPAATPLSVTTTSLAGGTTGTSYSQSLAATGGSKPYTWDISAGSLPNGLTLSAGVISGTPTVAGTYNFTVRVTDAVPNTATKALSIVVASGTAALSVTTNSLPNSEISVSYGSHQLGAAGGTQPYTWSISAGALPSGITLSSSGVVSGSASAPGTYNFTAQVTDAASATATQALSIVIAGAPQVVMSGNPNGTVGVAYSQTIYSTGGIPPYTYVLHTGALPPGLSLSASGGIAGTPSVAGDYLFSIMMTDSAGIVASTAGEEIVINSAPQVQIQQVQSNAAEGSSATSLSAAFPNANLSGNTIIVAMRASSVTPGITISDTLGNVYTQAIAQAHNSSGAWTSVIYYAKNVKAGVNTVTATFATVNFHPWLAVYEYSGLDATNLLDQTAGGDSGATQSTGAATSSVTTTAAAELLFGVLGLNTSATETVAAGTGYTAQLQDTATSRGFTEIQMTTAVGSYSATATLSTADYWSIALATFKAAAPTNVTPLQIVTTTLPNGAATAPYNQTLQATGGTPTYSWSIASGTLPMGLTLSGATISGTPTTSGTYSFTIQATDSGSPPATATQAETITILPAAVAGAYNSVLGGKASLGGNAVIH